VVRGQRLEVHRRILSRRSRSAGMGWVSETKAPF